MDLAEAEGALEDAELIPCAQAALADAKQLRDACLQADIPVVLDRGECCGKGGSGGGCGCAPKMQLFARSEDLPRITQLIHERWRAMALREGTIDEDHPATAAPAAGMAAVPPEAHGGPGNVSDADPPCPACGTAAPLVSGACSDCGLQLE